MQNYFCRAERQASTTGCTSPIGFCAGGTFKGNHGFRETSFQRSRFDPIVSDPLGRLVVLGISTYTTDDGVLTISDVSVFDTPRGTFRWRRANNHGNWPFNGATGNVFHYRQSVSGQGLVSLRLDSVGEIGVPN